MHVPFPADLAIVDVDARHGGPLSRGCPGYEQHSVTGVGQGSAFCRSLRCDLVSVCLRWVSVRPCVLTRGWGRDEAASGALRPGLRSRVADSVATNKAVDGDGNTVSNPMRVLADMPSWKADATLGPTDRHVSTLFSRRTA